MEPGALPYRNVTFLDGLDGLATVFPDLETDAPPDHTLFTSLSCIPRYSLSTGCGFRCRFCTVPTQLLLTLPQLVDATALALRPLEFELVFLDDKSFGEARNWREAGHLADVIRSYNPGFAGFIVQTPPSLAARPGFLAECLDIGVRYVELGVEIVDDEQLALLRKPFRRRHLDQAVDEARRLGLPLIPNLIMGISGADYEQTARWIEENADVLPVVNVNWLAVHHGNVRGTLPIEGRTVADGDQNSDHKSWLDERRRRADRETVERIYRATLSSGRPVGRR